MNSTGTTRTPIKQHDYTTKYTEETQYDGVAILVKTTIKHEFLPGWRYRHFLAAKIHTHHGPIIVATTYVRPNTDIPYGDINLLSNHNTPTYLIADLNARHTTFNHTSNNRLGNQLHQITTRKRLRFLGPDFNTYYSCGNMGKPDLAFTNRHAIHSPRQLAMGQRGGV